MGIHLAGWFENADQVALARINTVQDDVLTPSGAERFLVPDEYNHIHWAIASGDSLSGARIVTPSLEVSKMNLDIIPFNDGQDSLNAITMPIFVPRRPIELIPTENIEVQTSEDGGTTTMQAFVALGTGELEPMAEGQIRSIRATGTTTLIADQWTPVTLTLESSLEPGRYQLVHFLAFSGGCIAARFLPQGGGFRPGMFGIAGASPAVFEFNPAMWHQLGWFNMLEFTHITFPQIEMFSDGADTVETVQLYVIRLGDL